MSDPSPDTSETTRKPDTRTALANLMSQAREKLPFHLSFSGNCEGRCHECPAKLLEVLDTELAWWELRLQRGVVPSLGDVHRLARDCQEIHASLEGQGLVTP